MDASALSGIDLVFCVDLTGSMTPFIAAARLQMVRIFDALRGTPGVDLRVAIVGYRDHGSLEVVETHPFARDAAAVKKTLEGLVIRSPPENTDAAEAAFSGLVACVGLPWRKGVYRVVVLVGDAPPHGCGATASPYPDRFAVDPTGRSLDDMANELEAAGIFVHALAMIPSVTSHHDAVLETAWTRLGIGTGGSYHVARTGDAAMQVVETLSRRCFGDLDFDRKLFAKLERAPDASAAALASELGATEEAIFAAKMRLRQRGIISTS